MASRAFFLLTLNLLFFTLVSSHTPPKACPPPPPSPPACPPPPATPSPTPPTPTPSTPSPIPPTPSRPPKGTCPKDTLKFGICGNVLKDLLNLVLPGTPPKKPCCSLIDDLADLEAAVCLCTAINANVLCTPLNIHVSLGLSRLLNYCGKNVPSGFQCA